MKTGTWLHDDFPVHVILAVLGLSLVGIIALISIGLSQPGAWYQHSYVKQILFLLIAVSLAYLVYRLPVSRIHKYAYTFYGLGLVGVTMPYFFHRVAGTHRWISLGGIQVQPSELAKVFLVIALARFLSDHKPENLKFREIILSMILVAIPVGIVANQPDLGTALILFAPLFPMLFWAGARPYHLFLFIAPLLSILTAFHTLSFSLWGILLLGIIYLSRPTLLAGVTVYFSNLFLGLLSPYFWGLLKPYQQERILTFLNPEKDPLGSAYQIIQSQTAIGSGGLFGKGFGQGTQTHLKFLPVQESDFILSVIGEELGFIVIAAVLITFAWLLIRILRTSYECRDRFVSLMAMGFSIIFLAHVFVNAAMTVGMIPVKGLPLPFISYGGSFLVTSYIMLGLILKSELKQLD
ncbi:MAG: rod shape-determining protein RodA [Candidatus Neomarinimicrobiota bacterium]|nr:MAG: rod shape-determining protein RodA [Candidatus Neomarinimicrobiota bacterium]